MTVIDTNNNVLAHLDYLKDRGVTAVGRYYCSGVSKRIMPPEALAIAKAGMKIFVIFENDGNPTLSRDNGKTHAQVALTQAKAIRQPPGSAIYFALEHLPGGYTSADIPAIKTYMQGVNDVLHDQYRAGGL